MTGRYWLWLSRIEGIGLKGQQILLGFCSDPKKLFYMDSETLSQCLVEPVFREEVIESFYESRDLGRLIGYERRLKALGVSYVTIEDAEYPAPLKDIYDPPLVLYYRGTLRSHPLSIGVVGSRKCTAYGRKVAEAFGGRLAEAGVNVVSGMARGIDTYSHRGALNAGGFTTAVLGCGINICYPKENVHIMKEIIQNGCVISEYGLDVAPRKGHFPMRNRIISGLSQGVLLVEARSRSGSLITVDCALEMGRDVFAVPGDVLGRSNEGSNNVIRLGGKPVFGLEDILEEYDNRESLENDVSLNGGVREAVQREEEKLKLAGLDPEEESVYEQLGQIPIHLDELSTITGVEVLKLQFILTKLEIRELVTQLPGKNYIKQ